jgi:hypothetical protein
MGDKTPLSGDFRNPQSVSINLCPLYFAHPKKTATPMIYLFSFLLVLALVVSVAFLAFDQQRDNKAHRKAEKREKDWMDE